MTNKITLILFTLLLLWGCGSSDDSASSETSGSPEKKEHFLSDQQRALETARTAAGAIEAAAERNAKAVEKLDDDD